MQDLAPFAYPHHADSVSARLPGRIGLIALLMLCSVSALLGLPEEPVAPISPAGRVEGFIAPVAARTQPLYIIGKISIDERNVFDESDSSLLRVVGSVANKVHVLTDEDVIRRELLFKEGDLYDQRLVDESGQNLRRLGIVGDVSITSDTLADNTINITVRTRDRWTMRPGLSFRQDGYRGGLAVSVRDDNFLGNAQQLRLGYTYFSGPGSPHGGEVAFTEPRLWGSRWNMTVQYVASQEYRVGSFRTECPFLSSRDLWAARFSADVTHTNFLQYSNGEAIEMGFQNQESEVAWVASASGGMPLVEVAGAYSRIRTRALGMRPRSFENADFVIGSVSLLDRKYCQISSPDVAGRVEDVPLGYQAGVAFGRNLHLIKSGNVDYFGKIYGQRTMTLGKNFLVSYQAMVTAYFDRLVPYESIVSGIALHQLRLSENQSIIGRVAAFMGSRLDPVTQFVLGSSNGLRGYRVYEFIGQKMLLVNLEHRVLSLVKLWFVRLGGVLFFDSGAICGQDESVRKQRFHSSAGLGLRVNVGTAVLRLDAAYNLDQRRVSLGFSANQLFRVFAPLEFLSPVPEGPLR